MIKARLTFILFYASSIFSKFLLEAYDSPMDPSKMSLSERVQMFDSIGQNIGRPPRIGGATGETILR